MKKLLQAVCFMMMLLACTPARMALQSDDWRGREEYSVAGKRGLFTKERMSFGPFFTTEVKRSWVKGSVSRYGLGKGNVTDYDYTSIISYDHIKKNQTIRFSLTDGISNSAVYCASHFDAQELTIGNRTNSLLNLGISAGMTVSSHPGSKYYVQIYTTPHEKPWQLMLDNVEATLKPGAYTGILAQDDDHYFTISPVRQMEGRHGESANILFGLVGFEFRDSTGRPVAAVSLLNKGVVYFQGVSAQEKFLLANACAALLMQEVIG